MVKTLSLSSSEVGVGLSSTNINLKKQHFYWQGGYEEISNYRAIVENEVRGCFHVELIHTVFLLDLAHPVSDNVSFTDPEYYDTPHHHNLVPFFKSVSDKGRYISCLVSSISCLACYHNNIVREVRNILSR